MDIIAFKQQPFTDTGTVIPPTTSPAPRSPVASDVEGMMHDLNRLETWSAELYEAMERAEEAITKLKRKIADVKRGRTTGGTREPKP